MSTLVVQRIIKWSSTIALIFGLYLCVAYYFDKDVEFGTFLYFYVLLAGVLFLISVVALLIAGVFCWAERKKLFKTLVFITLLYISLVTALYLVDEVVEPVTKYALPR